MQLTKKKVLFILKLAFLYPAILAIAGYFGVNFLRWIFPDGEIVQANSAILILEGVYLAQLAFRLRQIITYIKTP